MSLLYLIGLKILVILICLLLIYWLFCKLGLRKIFPIPLILLLGISSQLLSVPNEPPPEALTAEQQAAIREEQMHIAAWYTDYKKDVEQMDIIWQQYHKTIAAFRNDEISIQTVYSRLFELQKKSSSYKAKYEKLQPPPAVSKENEQLISMILKKTQHYFEQQDRVIADSCNRIMPQNLKTHIFLEQLQLLDKVMILESPSNLDISQELTKIKASLVIPGEK